MQTTKIQQEMEITLRVHFDDIDMTILDVFRKYPSRRYKVNQLPTLDGIGDCFLFTRLVVDIS